MKILKNLISLSCLSLIGIGALYLNMILNNPNPHLTFVRNYEKYALNYSGSFEIPVVNIGDIQFYNSRIYISDLNKQQIVEMDTLGNLIRAYGNNCQGSDTSYFSLIIGWGIDKEGIYIADAPKAELYRLKFNNMIADDFSTRFPVVRAAYLGNNNFIVKSADSIRRDQEIFMHVDMSNKRARILNNPFPLVEDGDFVFDGFFVNNLKGQYFHICYMMGSYQAFDLDGNFRYVKQTIDKSPAPEIIRAGGSKRFHPLAKIVNFDASANDNFLYILSGARSIKDQKDKRAIDIYNMKNGEYVASLIVPNYKGTLPGELLVTNSSIFTFHSNIACRYEMKSK